MRSGAKTVEIGAEKVFSLGALRFFQEVKVINVDISSSRFLLPG